MQLPRMAMAVAAALFHLVSADCHPGDCPQGSSCISGTSKANAAKDGLTYAGRHCGTSGIMQCSCYYRAEPPCLRDALCESYGGKCVSFGIPWQPDCPPGYRKARSAALTAACQRCRCCVPHKAEDYYASPVDTLEPSYATATSEPSMVTEHAFEALEGSESELSPAMEYVVG